MTKSISALNEKMSKVEIYFEGSNNGLRHDRPNLESKKGDHRVYLSAHIRQFFRQHGLYLSAVVAL